MARTTGGGRRLAVFAVAISTLAGIAAFLYLYLPEDLTAALWILTACSLALAGGVALQARVLAGQAVQLPSDSTWYQSASCGSRRSARRRRRRRPIRGSTICPPTCRKRRPRS